MLGQMTPQNMNVYIGGIKGDFKLSTQYELMLSSNSNVRKL